MQQIRGVGPALVSVLLLLTAAECIELLLPQPQDTSGSGSGVAELWAPGEGGRCGVPPYAPQPVSNTEEDTLAKLRCHLACIGRKNLGLEAVWGWKNATVWPYYVMNVTIQSHCRHYREMHECERGCFLWSKGEFRGANKCRRACFTGCKEEMIDFVSCNDYNKCSEICTHGCTKTACEDGCKLYKDYIKGPNDIRPPVNPVAPPELSIPEDYSAAGVYNINLTQAMTNLSNISEDGPTGLIFRLQDLQSGNVTYIHLINPEEPLVLTAYACKELSVSFSVANKHIHSDYSPTLNITVYGDLRKIPNPVTNLHVTQKEDQRLGFFGHAILNATWSHPDDMQYLDCYKVEVTSKSDANVCVSDPYISGPLPPNTTSYMVKANNYSDLPVLACSYDIKVYSVGKDNHTERNMPYSVSRFDPECIQFMCSRLWDSYRYFSFNTTWILPPHVVFSNTITSFHLITRLINTEGGETPQMYFGLEDDLPTQEVNKTTYTYMLIGSDEKERQFVPQRNLYFKYRIEMTINWLNGSDLIYVPGRHTYRCTIDATAPPPSVVRNLTVYSYRFTAGQNEIELGFNWDTPAVVNGRQVERYQVSIGPYALRPDEETPQSNSLNDCKGNCTSTIWKTSYLASSSTHCLYFQMRAHNEFVAGNWTEPHIIPRNIDTAVQLECSSGWSSQHDNLTVNISWSVLLPCTRAERPALWFTLHPLVVNTSSEDTAPIAGYDSSLGVIVTAEEGHGIYSYTFDNLQVQEDLSRRYKFVLQPEWDERILGRNFSCMVDAVPVSCGDPGTPANAQREGDSFLYGNQVVFTCDNGYYQSSGPEGGVRTCMETGLWSESQPTCAFTEQQSHVSWLAILCLLGVVLVVVVATMLCHKFRKRKRQLQRISKEPFHDPMFSSGPKKLRRTNNITPTTDEWELPPSHVIIEDCLGEGAFGEVYRGIIRGPIMNPKVHPSMKSAICTTVAIKLLKLSAKGSERRDFLQEIEMMKKVSEGQNPHVVTLIGCVTIQEPLSLITEYVKYGDLLTYLRTNRQLFSKDGSEDEENLYLELGNVSPLDLISFAYQIASGMEYLSSLGIVHRDLACRNVLVGEGKALKITDFGMSRETEEVYVQKTKGRVPLKWMAVESITSREFTTASDVWAYGVVLWEIGTLGGFPYPSIQNEDLLSLLKRGYRMEKPDNCSSDVYDIMLECWNEEPRKRPTFSQLRASFDALLLAERKDAYIVLQVDTEKPYYTSDSKEFLHIAPLSAKRKSQLSVDIDTEKPASSHESSLQGSPRPSDSFHGHCSPLSLSPCHENSPQPRRPASMHLLRSDQQQQPVVNPYVDEPSRPRTKLLVPGNTTQDVSRRRRSDGNIQLSGDARSSAPSIQITVSPGPE